MMFGILLDEALCPWMHAFKGKLWHCLHAYQIMEVHAMQMQMLLKALKSSDFQDLIYYLDRDVACCLFRWPCNPCTGADNTTFAEAI